MVDSSGGRPKIAVESDGKMLLSFEAGWNRVGGGYWVGVNIRIVLHLRKLEHGIAHGIGITHERDGARIAVMNVAAANDDAPIVAIDEYGVVTELVDAQVFGTAAFIMPSRNWVQIRSSSVPPLITTSSPGVAAYVTPESSAVRTMVVGR